MIYCVTGMVKRVVNAKIACLDFSLQKTKMKMGVQVIINDPEKLDQIRQRWFLNIFFAFSLNRHIFKNHPIKFTVLLHH